MFQLTGYIIFIFIGLSTAVPAELYLQNVKNDISNKTKSDSDSIYNPANSETYTDDLGLNRYNPEINNVYHLFTRANPSESNPLLLNSQVLLQNSNYNNLRRTILLIHGFRNHATSLFNVHLVPALLNAEDLNVIVVDWSSGASGSYESAVTNTITSGNSVAAFINWLNSETGSSPVQYHIVGHGLGGHLAGIAARRTNGVITYVTGLDPALIGWINNSERFQADDGLYTEVIHTNIGINGYLGELAKVDFYPNGGENMPGCETNACSHERSYLYFAESLLSGGLTGRRCVSLASALLGACNLLPGPLPLGTLTPKIGQSGIFFVPTFASSPFSQG